MKQRMIFFILIFILLLFIPRTNSKYFLTDNKVLGVKSSKFNVTVTTNGPLTIRDNKSDYLRITFKNNENKEVRADILVNGYRLGSVVVSANNSKTSYYYLSDSNFNSLSTGSSYPVLVKYTAPYKSTRNVTSVKKLSSTLYDKIKKESLGTDTSKGIDYGRANSNYNGEGVYILNESKNDTNPVYFYRGTHDLNNNLIYANFCWKIVRTTDTGGIRIVFNGYASSGRCTTTTGTQTQIGSDIFNRLLDPPFIGYMFGEPRDMYGNRFDSMIKERIDTWYRNNILNTSYESKLDRAATYCGDRRRGRRDPGGYTFIVVDRIERNHPTMECLLNDSYGVNGGNGALNYPIALLSADEVKLAGLVNSRTPNTNFYLFNEEEYWLMSPSAWDVRLGASVIFVDRLGGSAGMGVNRVLGIRPALTIVKSTPLLSGTGSKTNPYVI